MDNVLVGKVTISGSLKKTNFPKISEQAPLIDHMMRYGQWKVVCCFGGTMSYVASKK